MFNKFVQCFIDVMMSNHQCARGRRPIRSSLSSTVDEMPGHIQELPSCSCWPDQKSPTNDKTTSFSIQTQRHLMLSGNIESTAAAAAANNPTEENIGRQSADEIKRTRQHVRPRCRGTPACAFFGPSRAIASHLASSDDRQQIRGHAHKSHRIVVVVVVVHFDF